MNNQCLNAREDISTDIKRTSHGNVKYRGRMTTSHGNIKYRGPTTTRHGNVKYIGPMTTSHGNVKYRGPTTIKDIQFKWTINKMFNTGGNS